MVFSAKLCFFRYLLSQYDSFIDRSRIGVNGVSYGGYVAGMMLSETSANHSSLLKCGVAVCPVVDWRYYGICWVLNYLDQASYLDILKKTQGGQNLKLKEKTQGFGKF